MANPRVFVSSTCFDLFDIRDSLDSFIRSYNFEPILSDKGDVFYGPDLHTHDACIKEVESCQLFILIIGGRFGGEYYLDKKQNSSDVKSITNREYETARKNNIPVFTFIKRNLLENHNIYINNSKNNPDIKNIHYPAVDKQEYSEAIFQFIDAVRHSSENNAFFAFDYSKEIQELLGKQWAGMFYDFLIERQKRIDAQNINDLLGSLAIAQQKTEDLVKEILSNQPGVEAKSLIETTDKEAEAKRFFKDIISFFYLSSDSVKLLVHSLNDALVPDNWYDFLDQSPLFELWDDIWNAKGSGVRGKIELTLTTTANNRLIVIKNKILTEMEQLRIDELDRLYKYYKELTREEREKVLKSLLR